MPQYLVRKLVSLCAGAPAVIVCVGTDLVGGDCLGPLVGQLLVEYDVPAYVYGTLDNPITAVNVDHFNDFVRRKHPASTIVAVDSAVGGEYDRGKITVCKSALLPGAAGGKKLKALGDVSITAVTSSCRPKDKGFSGIGLGFVYPLALKISALIAEALTNA